MLYTELTEESFLAVVRRWDVLGPQNSHKATMEVVRCSTLSMRCIQVPIKMQWFWYSPEDHRIVDIQNCPFLITIISSSNHITADVDVYIGQ